MFFRLLYDSFRRQRRRKLLAGAAVFLAMVVVTAMIAVGADIGDKMNRELRTYGANLVIYPQEDNLDVEIGGINLKPVSQGAFLRESDLPKIKSIFWHNNIYGFAPFLTTSVLLGRSGASSLSPVELEGTYFAKSLNFGKDSFITGVRKIDPWWRVEGAWPADDSDSLLVGEKFAARLAIKTGDHVILKSDAAGSSEVTVAGILRTGGTEDEGLVAPLNLAQRLAGKPGAVRRVLVSALTKPEDAFARKDPAKLKPQDYDRWYCSPYANSIALQLREAIPHAQAEQVRQVAQNEGQVLSRISGLMWFLALASICASILAVAAAMTTSVVQRRREVGLMKSLGARDSTIAALFLTESGLLAVAAGSIGFLVGALLAKRMGVIIFGSKIVVEPVLFPITLAIAIAITLLGSAVSIRRAMRFDPAILLRVDK